MEMISSCLVGRENNEIANSITRLELNPWDLRLLPIVPIQRGLIYHKPQSQNIISHLKNSLSRTLNFFPPLAGRLSATHHDDCTKSYFVDCNNAGAEFTHAATASISVSDLIGPKYIPEIVYSFFPLDSLTNFEAISKPLLAVQVTELADGLFLGCAANHAVVDGTSFWHFINSWSEISRGLKNISKTPVFSRSTKPVKVGNHLTPRPMVETPPLLRKVFHLGKERLTELKNKANSTGGSDKISSYQALAALLWRTITRCQKFTNMNMSSSREIYFALVVGARSRIGLDEGYFGNAIYTAGTSTTERELLQNGIGYAAVKINELVKQQTREAVMENFEDSENRAFIRKLPSFFIIGSPRHDVYGNDFGWGKPVAVRCGRGRDIDGKITVFAAAECGGVDLEVSLAAEKMVAMENDTEFTAALAH
ncbi:uncharacterized acetyltransferase At3g50280-like [Salvia hispanica]|uniref:uncharacterized acetyltransferase At3g50280-like n=1 Tax=Salvia hispanica TaxID=49212 RepID=UPI002009621A|nr:uncharacterized acetyltransferase At3g50280-like [Salvia hispanica]